MTRRVQTQLTEEQRIADILYRHQRGTTPRSEDVEFLLSEWTRLKALADAYLAAQRAISEAAYALDPNQGEKPDPSLAYRWLRTTFPADHPNYVDPATIK